MRIRDVSVYNYEIKQQSDSGKINELLEENQNELERIKEQFENSAEDTKNSREAMKILITCLKISQRIIAGDIVPVKDHKFLREHDPALYAKSVLMRIPKKKPYKYKQLSEDDKNQNKLQDKPVTNDEDFGRLITHEPTRQDVSGPSIDVKI
ncbi:MAG TPA: hypothetical protein VFC70_04440 [Oscillospiraceae bacterium]|nr:hypothetical protein [Oscillospiraceae bacterium]